jgi:hypothetical protein
MWLAGDDRRDTGATATAATIAPAPGIGPSGVGKLGSSFVAMNRAPARTAALAEREPCVVEVVVQTHDDGIGGPVAHHVAPRASTASTTPAPPHTSTVSPASTSEAPAWALVTTSPSAGTPIAASAASWSATSDIELLVTNTTRHRRAEPVHRLGRPWDGATGQPHHPVEITQDVPDVASRTRPRRR